MRFLRTNNNLLGRFTGTLSGVLSSVFLAHAAAAEGENKIAAVWAHEDTMILDACPALSETELVSIPHHYNTENKEFFTFSGIFPDLGRKYSKSADNEGSGPPPLNSKPLNSAANHIVYLPPEKEATVVLFNSKGGFNAARLIYNAMLERDGRLTTEGEGLIASWSATLLTAPKIQDRYLLEGATVLTHLPAHHITNLNTNDTKIYFSSEALKRDGHHSFAEKLDVETALIKDHFLEATDHSIQCINAYLRPFTDVIFTDEAALKIGLVGGIYNTDDNGNITELMVREGDPRAAAYKEAFPAP